MLNGDEKALAPGFGLLPQRGVPYAHDVVCLF